MEIDASYFWKERCHHQKYLNFFVLVFLKSTANVEGWVSSSDIFHSPSLLPAMLRGKEQQVKLGTGAQLLTLALLPAPATLCKLFLCLCFVREMWMQHHWPCWRLWALTAITSAESLTEEMGAVSALLVLQGKQREPGWSGSVLAVLGMLQHSWSTAVLSSILPGLSCKKGARSLLGKSQVLFLSVRGLWQGWAGGLGSMPEHPDLFNNNLIHLTQNSSGLAGVRT